MNKYEYDPTNLVACDSVTGVKTFKGRLKNVPNKIVYIKKTSNYKAYSNELEKIQNLEKDGVIKYIESLHGRPPYLYIIFTKIAEPKSVDITTAK